MGRRRKIKTQEDAARAMEKQREYQREYRERNREKILEQKRNWLKNHPEKNRAAVAKHYAKVKAEHENQEAKNAEKNLTIDEMLDSIKEDE